MFLSYSSEIIIKRTECDGGNRSKVLRRNSAICKKVIINDLLKKATGNNKRVIKANEIAAGMALVEPFITEWNRLKQQYIEGVYISSSVNKSQISIMHKIMTMCEKENIMLDVFLACAFMAWKNAPQKLYIQHVLNHGMDYYNQYSEQIFNAMDEEVNLMRNYGFGF